MDNAITVAGGLALGSDPLTSEFTINHVRPARGTRLAARAGAESVGRRPAVRRCEIHAVEGEARTLRALARGTVVPAPRGEAPA